MATEAEEVPVSGLAEFYELRFEEALAKWNEERTDLSSPICRFLIFEPGTPDLYRAWSHLLLAMTENEDNLLYHATKAEQLMRVMKEDNPGNDTHLQHWNLAKEILDATGLDAQNLQEQLSQEKESQIAEEEEDDEDKDNDEAQDHSKEAEQLVQFDDPSKIRPILPMIKVDTADENRLGHINGADHEHGSEGGVAQRIPRDAFGEAQDIDTNVSSNCVTPVASLGSPNFSGKISQQPSQKSRNKSESSNPAISFTDVNFMNRNKITNVGTPSSPLWHLSALHSTSGDRTKPVEDQIKLSQSSYNRVEGIFGHPMGSLRKRAQLRRDSLQAENKEETRNREMTADDVD